MIFNQHLYFKFAITFLTMLTTNCNIITECNSKTCDESGGICISRFICECKDDYTTFMSQGNFKFCNYQKKSKAYTAIFELFFGFGVGHFYAERKLNGYFKMTSFFFLCYFSCCAIAIGAKIQGENLDDNRNSIKFFFGLYVCFMLIMLVWQIIDFLMIILGIYKDGNDIPLS